MVNISVTERLSVNPAWQLISKHDWQQQQTIPGRVQLFFLSTSINDLETDDILVSAWSS